MQLNLHMSEKSSTFEPDFVRLCKITTNNYKPQTTKTMSANNGNTATQIPAGGGFGRPVAPAGCCL